MNLVISDGLRGLARTLVMETGDHSNSITKNTRRFEGYLAELVFGQMYPDATYTRETNYDYRYEGRRVDIKSLVSPYSPREVSVFHRAYLNQCDTLCWLRLAPMFQFAEVVGYISPSEFMDKAQFRQKGTRSPVYPDHKHIADCWNLDVRHLSSTL